MGFNTPPFRVNFWYHKNLLFRKCLVIPPSLDWGKTLSADFSWFWRRRLSTRSRIHLRRRKNNFRRIVNWFNRKISTRISFRTWEWIFEKEVSYRHLWRKVLAWFIRIWLIKQNSDHNKFWKDRKKVCLQAK